MKFGTLYAYWVSNWGADYCEMARKAKKAGFDVIEIGAGDLIDMSDAQLAYCRDWRGKYLHAGAHQRVYSKERSAEG